MINLILNFILGGLIFIAIHISSNIYQNPELSAVISLLPISIISVYIINKTNVAINHSIHLLYVSLITIFCVILLLYILKRNILKKNIAVTIILIIWIILQFLKSKYFSIKK